MRTYEVDLAKEYNVQGGTLKCILADEPHDQHDPNWKRPAVVVVPGGGYAMVSKREGEPVAFEFLARGFQTFVLTYLVGGENGFSYPEQLLELSSAMDYVKKNAKELGVNEKEVFVVGFSAGGHLVGDLAVECDDVPQKAGRDLDCRPTAVGLCYPVISHIHGHQGSYDNLLYGYSDEAKGELLKTLSLDRAVKETTPPAFIWALTKDGCVPVDNALRYAQACSDKNVNFELHVYPGDTHGTSTGALEINVPRDFLPKSRAWLEDCASFFRLYVEEKF